MSRFCLRPRVRADIPGASRPKIETHQRPLDAKSNSRATGRVRIFAEHRRFSRENPTDHVAKRVDRNPNRIQRGSQRAVGPALEDGLCRDSSRSTAAHPCRFRNRSWDFVVFDANA